MINLDSTKVLVVNFDDVLCIYKVYGALEREEEVKNKWRGCDANIHFLHFMRLCNLLDITVILLTDADTGVAKKQVAWVRDHYPVEFVPCILTPDSSYAEILQQALGCLGCGRGSALVVDYEHSFLEYASSYGAMVCSPMEVVNYMQALGDKALQREREGKVGEMNSFGGIEKKPFREYSWKEIQDLVRTCSLLDSGIQVGAEKGDYVVVSMTCGTLVLCYIGDEKKYEYHEAGSRANEHWYKFNKKFDVDVATKSWLPSKTEITQYVKDVRRAVGSVWLAEDGYTQLCYHQDAVLCCRDSLKFRMVAFVQLGN